MYAPQSFRELDVGRLHDFIDRYGFSTVVSSEASMTISHLPLVLERTHGEYGTLIGHMAKANAHWREFDGERGVVCIFHGPHGYVSPTWYEVRPAVPTWNYAVVHATGRPRVVEKSRLERIIDRMVAAFEPSLLDEGGRLVLPDAYRAQLLDHIVGFEIGITDLRGKFKLSQNRSPADRRGVLAGLAANADEDALRLLRFMQAHVDFGDDNR